MYDIEADPSEQHDLALSDPALLNLLLKRLAHYNATNVPCCICTGSSRTSEMDVPPRDGYWFSFHDQSPNPDPNCRLQSEAMVQLDQQPLPVAPDARPRKFD